MISDQDKFLLRLKEAFESFYSPISHTSWQAILEVVQFQKFRKGEVLLEAGQIARCIHFICQGAVRTYYSDEQGSLYTKNIFLEKDFPAATVSLLLQEPSCFTIEALENSLILNIDFKTFRKLVQEQEDMKNFYIAYIEKKWIIEKEQREISLVMETATERYLALLKKYPKLEQRIQQQHLASHLGITPTQLSRIRKELKKEKNQHM